MLSSTPIIAPTYFIVAGIAGNEGAIISRDRFEVAYSDELTDTKWYLI